MKKIILGLVGVMILFTGYILISNNVKSAKERENVGISNWSDCLRKANSQYDSAVKSAKNSYNKSEKTSDDKNRHNSAIKKAKSSMESAKKKCDKLG